MNRVIKFRAKDFRSGTWYYGSLKPDMFEPYEVRLSLFWEYIEEGILDPNTICEYVEFENHDGSKGCGFEKDIIEHGGDNHNGVITFGQSHEVVGFHVKESVCQKQGEKIHRTHGLPPTTATVKIIGDTINDKKLASRWGRS